MLSICRYFYIIQYVNISVEQKYTISKKEGLNNLSFYIFFSRNHSILHFNHGQILITLAWLLTEKKTNEKFMVISASMM